MTNPGFAHGADDYTRSSVDCANPGQNEPGISRTLRDGSQRPHAWDSGWLPEAVALPADSCIAPRDAA
jgi:hypothetical protein